VPGCTPEPGSERDPDAFASPHGGVGHSTSETHDEVPDPAVGRPDVSGGDSGDLHLVTKPVKPGRHRVQVPPSESTDVLDEDALRRELPDESLELEPEAGSLTGVDAAPLAGK
jgi:hypothetical protein